MSQLLYGVTSNSVQHGWNTTVKKKEMIHPHLPVGIPCYDFIMVTNITVDAAPLEG